jgi:hypothetical protein
MRLLPGLVLALIFGLTASALLALPAQAVQCYIPFIDLYPDSGVPGTEITVQGQRFYEDAYVSVYFDDDRVATGRTDGNEKFAITFTIPESCRGAHRVYAEVLDETAEANLSVKPGLAVSPQKGPVGTMVTVKGRGFAQNEESIELLYYANDSYQSVEGNITANAIGSWKTSFVIPPSTKEEHKIDAQSDETRSYDVEDAVFKVTPRIIIDKSSGIVGESITMTGVTFMAYESHITILFDGQAVVADIEADAQGNWRETFAVPAMPTGEHSITAQGEWTPKEDISPLSFEIEPGLALSPDEGYAAMNLTVTGHGFAANKDAVVNWDGSQKATAKTNEQGSFEVTFPVPESHYGERQVTAEDTEGNETEQPAIFTMESDPPNAPVLVSPAAGSSAGLISRTGPTFEWSEVSDDSGVYYSLQIATAADITTGSVIFSVTGLTGTSYTPDRNLSYGTYYWRVQAVDGAENESGWTAARCLGAGVLPLWAFIAIITAAAVGLIALVRHLLMKRGKYY